MLLLSGAVRQHKSLLSGLNENFEGFVSFSGGVLSKKFLLLLRAGIVAKVKMNFKTLNQH